MLSYGSKEILVIQKSNFVGRDLLCRSSYISLDKVTDINDEDEEDIDEDEPVEPPKLADGKPESLVAFSFADKQELTQKIMNLDPQSLASIIQIVQKFEKIEDGAEIELDIDRFSSQTLHALQEFIHTGLVPGK